MNRIDAVSQNLAHSASPGYRRVQVCQKPFDSTLRSAVSEASESGVVVDHSQGPLRTTGNPFDFAISGDAFFAVEKDGAEYYTRNGGFNVSSSGTLVTSGGLAVRGESGTISIPENADTSALVVKPDGTMTAGGSQIGRLKMVEFSNPQMLRPVGTSLFAAPDGVSAEDSENSRVINCTLEGSNTSLFDEMAELFSCMRGYEACQKMLRSQDEAERKMITRMS